ncbi:glycosyltransferase family 2 protein [Clostridium cibarium]|uniref:Glycosyltransferase family 2 protein n=1 Tax=Clostridium cibarium TaxID=2762247 RepID=A0ABR8PPX0_9CLOT|nr:glycosyltransferase family 2 protein [Clostridium cibarium]MBD7910216.1 glycosyltransferase family 2 protein [Clostridium cibarium]
MNEDKLLDVVRIGGDPVNSIEITSGKVHELKYRSNEYNIRKLMIFLSNVNDFKGLIKVDIFEDEYGSLVGEQILQHVEEGWNELEFSSARGVFEENLTIKIYLKEGDRVLLGTDKYDNVCMRLFCDKVDREMALELDKAVKDLRKIYNSSGWRGLVRVYRGRDIFLNFFRGIKKIGPLCVVVIKNLNVSNFNRAKDFIKENGFKSFVFKALRKLKGDRLDYKFWIDQHVISEAELESQKSYVFEYEPLISILIPTYKTPKHLLIETIDSVLKQSYRNWELCIADGASELEYINQMLDSYAEKDDRIKVKYLDENKGIAGNTQECYYMATGDYIGLFDHDDLLEPNALFEIVKAVNEDKTIDFIYTDEDKINEKSDYRFDPHFKQDYAVDTFRSYNYICHFSVFRKDLMDKISGFRDGFNGSQDYDIILRATEQAKNIHHIPKILYSWRVHSGSTAGNPRNKMYCYDSAKKAIDEELVRKGIKGKTRDGKYIGTYEVDYEIIGNPKVSILIPTKDHIEDLNRTIVSVIEKTDYKNYEIIVIENNSEQKDTFEYYKEIQEKYENIKVVTWEKGFNYSAINNYGAQFATGDFILLLNNDVEVINKEWLTKMIGLAQREDVGCVGAKLYYPDNTIQHGGIIVGLGGAAAHAHRCFKRKEYGYFLRLGITHNLSAVTGACLLVKKSVFDEVGGLDETFEVAYNDVDFCLRVLKTGRVNAWTPYAELYHYESKSRGKEDTEEKAARFKGEFDRFRERYSDFLEKGDPYYNVNLTLDKEDFTLRY